MSQGLKEIYSFITSIMALNVIFIGLTTIVIFVASLFGHSMDEWLWNYYYFSLSFFSLLNFTSPSKHADVKFSKLKEVGNG